MKILVALYILTMLISIRYSYIINGIGTLKLHLITTKGAAATARLPTAVPTALAPEATAPIPDATDEPAEATAAPADPSPIVERALPIPDEAELTELENAFTALLLALEIELPMEFAPIADNAAPELAPTVAPAVPTIAL